MNKASAVNGQTLDKPGMEGAVKPEVGNGNQKKDAAYNNGAPLINGFVKVEVMKRRTNGVTKRNGNGDAVSTSEGEVEDAMDGIEEIKISEAMDVDDEMGVGGKAEAEIIKVPGKANGSVGVKSENFGVKTESEEANGVNTAPFPPPPKCANSKLTCQLDGSSAFPCKRCHRVFYCSEEHRGQHFKDHQPDCKTVSSLEVIVYEDQYSMWLKHAAPHFYDICLNFVLVWPSLTAQWLPDLIEIDNNTVRHKLLLGTMTNQEQNHLLICGIDVPVRTKTDGGGSDHASKYCGTMFVEKRINHDGEVNRARYMPQDSSIVATKSSSSEVFIFDCKKYPEVPEDSKFAPHLRLKGHKKEGFGLSWNIRDQGKILSGSYDALVCMWDLQKSASSDSKGRYLDASRTFTAHEDVVEDVNWHPEHCHVFASVGDDKRLILWDARDTKGDVCIQKDAHEQDINAVSFSPYSEFCLATGSSDTTVAIWDMRNLKKKVLSLEYHRGEVMQVQWSPHNSSILASTGKDNRVFVWDLSKAAKESNDSSGQLDEDPAPPELSFIHGGHIAHVNDISWNMHETGMIASVTEDNILQVWKITEDLQSTFKGEDSDDDSFGGSASETFDE